MLIIHLRLRTPPPLLLPPSPAPRSPALRAASPASSPRARGRASAGSGRAGAGAGWSLARARAPPGAHARRSTEKVAGRDKGWTPASKPEALRFERLLCWAGAEGAEREGTCLGSHGVRRPLWAGPGRARPSRPALLPAPLSGLSGSANRQAQGPLGTDSTPRRSALPCEAGIPAALPPAPRTQPVPCRLLDSSEGLSAGASFLLIITL